MVITRGTNKGLPIRALQTTNLRARKESPGKKGRVKQHKSPWRGHKLLRIILPQHLPHWHRSVDMSEPYQSVTGVIFITMEPAESYTTRIAIRSSTLPVSVGLQYD